MKKILTFIVIVVVAAGAYFGYQSLIRSSALAAARAPLVSSLHDPSSVQFRNELKLTRAGVRCGEFNAKNGLGGYGGFRRFISDGKQYAVEDSALSSWNIETTIPSPEPELIEMHQRLQDGKWGRAILAILSKELFGWLWKTQCGQ
jgi:hypothetical protein